MTKKYQPPSIALFSDFQNVPLSQADVANLKTLVSLKGKLKLANIYYNASNLSQTTRVKDLLQSNHWLQDKGIHCCLKSNNVDDDKLIVDGIKETRQINSSDIFIIVSGDEDFSLLAEIVKEKGKILIIIGRNKNISKKLQEYANSIYYIENLGQEILEINNLNSSKEIESKTIISYAEAVKYLMKSIQLCIKKKKSTSLSYIEGLMRKECPNYQGCSSILMPDEGEKTFSKWSKFISMVAEMLNLVTKLNISRHGNPKMTKLACKDNPSEPVYIARILTHETL